MRKIKKIAQEHMQYRKDKHPLEFPNSGSIFKNCDVRLFTQDQQKEFAHVVKHDPFPVVPTAYLIARANLQKLRVGDAEVSEKHPNYIVNRGNATAEDVRSLVEKVKEKIQEQCGIELEVEVQFVS